MPQHFRLLCLARKQAAYGFSLIELLVVLAIAGLLSGVALPSYRQHVARAARLAVQGELQQLATLQEKIYLNSNSYAFGAMGLRAAYNGTAAGGLGRSSGRSNDGRYALSLVVLASDALCTEAGASDTASGSQSFVLMATPLADGPQAAEPSLCVAASGKRLWGAVAW